MRKLLHVILPFHFRMLLWNMAVKAKIKWIRNLFKTLTLFSISIQNLLKRSDSRIF